MADELLALVIAGEKRATAWAAVHGTQGSEVGKKMYVKNGEGEPKVVVETLEITKKKFNEVDETFAYDEGEGDKTLVYWRQAHTDYFTREGTFAENMEVYCERFKLVEVLD